MMKKSLIVLFAFAGICPIYADKEIVKAIPDTTLLQRPFDAQDATLFQTPKKMFFPETWFHYVNGNVDRAGITADLEAIAAVLNKAGYITSSRGKNGGYRLSRAPDHLR